MDAAHPVPPPPPPSEPPESLDSYPPAAVTPPRRPVKVADPPLRHSYGFHLWVLALHVALLGVVLVSYVWAPPFARGWQVGWLSLATQAVQVAGAAAMAVAVAPGRAAPVTHRVGRLVYRLYSVAGATAVVVWASTGVVGWTLLLGYSSSGRYTESGSWWLRRPWVAVSMGVTGFVTAVVTGADVWACAWLVPPKQVEGGSRGGGGARRGGRSQRRTARIPKYDS